MPQRTARFNWPAVSGRRAWCRAWKTPGEKTSTRFLLQSLLADARSLTESDPVQSLRLLEHAHRHFPDSSRILQQAGELVNQPNLWLHSLKAPQIWPSPGLRYVVAALSPARLFACQGDSLTTLYTFDSPVEDVFFSPDERYVWVATQAGSWLLDCWAAARAGGEPATRDCDPGGVRCRWSLRDG